VFEKFPELVSVGVQLFDAVEIIKQKPCNIHDMHKQNRAAKNGTSEVQKPPVR
jgi:hypothetical protein